jgi:hypothetical protein
MPAISITNVDQNRAESEIGFMLPFFVQVFVQVHFDGELNPKFQRQILEQFRQ